MQTRVPYPREELVKKSSTSLPQRIAAFSYALPMRHVHATATLDCGSAVAEALIPKFFELQKDRSGAAHMILEVPLDDLGLPTHAAIAREVEVRITRERDEDNLNDVFRVIWTPARGGPFPDFNGTMIVWSEDDPDRGFIELNGDYKPAGAVGEALDVAMGHRIAERTAKHFLDKIADGISALRTTNA